MKRGTATVTPAELRQSIGGGAPGTATGSAS